MKYYKLYIFKQLLFLNLILINERDDLSRVATSLCKDDKVHRYNENYVLSTNRTQLKQHAQNIKNLWIDELETKLEQVKQLKI